MIFFQGETERENQDYISYLPDDIMVQILSRLPLSDAVRMNVLSRNWEKLWSLNASILDFEAAQKMKDMRWGRRDQTEKNKYVKWVDQTLRKHQAGEVEELRICFDLNRSFSDYLDRWIEFAAEKRVKRFELDLSNIYGRVPGDAYSPNFLMPSAIPWENRKDRFNFLTDLALSAVDISGEGIESLLANFPCLERLRIRRLKRLDKLNVAGPSLKLKSLEIVNCNLVGTLEISAPNLVLFEFHHRMIPLFGVAGELNRVTIKDAPLLSNVIFGGGIVGLLCYPSCTLFRYFSQLRTLKLDVPSLTQTFIARNHDIEIPKLDQLEQLELFTYDNMGLIFPCLLIKVAPVLRRFSMKMRFQGLPDSVGPERIRRMTGVSSAELRQKCQYTHDCLKEVELIGFNGEYSNVELGLTLIAIARNLEKMIIDIRPPILEEGPYRTFISPVLSEATSGVEELKRNVRPETNLVIIGIDNV
ncbi:hypothetical protein UlMin_031778 [Ulmus minor]